MTDRDSGPGPRTLFLELREPVSVWLACLALALFYAVTMARDLSLYDSGELALAAVQLGLGHPPGQPLHTGFGFILAHLPFVPPLVGVGLLSVIPGALSLVPAASLAQRLLGPHASRSTQRAMPWLLAAIALHPSLWEPATRVEVYALATLFALWSVAKLASLDTRVSSRVLFGPAIVLGLCASVNPMLALCTGLALAPSLLLSLAHGRLPARAVPYVLLGGVLGLLPYLYVPLIAHRSDVMVWGAPRDAHALWRYLSLRDYAHNQHITAPVWGEHAWLWFRASFDRGLGPVLGLGLAAHLLLGGRTGIGRATAPLLLFLLVALISFNVVWNLDVPDYDGYTACALWLAAAGAVALCARVHALGRRLSAHILAAALVLAAIGAPPHVFARTRQRDHLARELGERVLREAPTGAIVVANADHFAGSLFYLQEAEQKRPDVIVLAYGLSSSSWHWERVYRMHPQLFGFALQGTGGRPGRVRRFLAANRQRPVLIEDFTLAAEIGVAVCPGGLYLRAGETCGSVSAPDPSPATLLARNLAELASGSPGAAGAIAQTAYGLGVSLWRLGQARAAYTALLAGVPRAMQPPSRVSLAALEGLAPLLGPMPEWRRGAALGDPARNLFVAAAILRVAAQKDAELAHLRAAADDGLPEALGLLSAPR